MKLSLSLVVAALSLTAANAAHATTVTGSDSITFFNVAAHPGPGVSLDPISGITDFTWSAGLTSSTGTMDFGIIPALTPVTGSGAFYPNSALGETGTTPFTFTIGSFGTFTETSAPSVVTNGQTGSASAVNIYVLGLFTPTGALSSFTAGPASFDVSFNENGSAVAGFSYTGGGPLTSPPAGTSPTPEPSSLILLGTGLIGAAGAARRRFKK